ncbi:hypothetical protein CUR178_04160 [Leishmania enriettii]|uniref:Uncharacterized protein n=1 Tax=Leishmania enriettii TaxID=5663 RepID=A0A836KF90_LEIEN|nr:hypothetical protein CUR178_04160 [Leishmania enriettii]
MQYSASTQQLLDELAARERRVLQQLRDLSGMNQSPIAPIRPYASLPVTPVRFNTVSPHSASSATLSRLLPSPSAVEREGYQVEKLSCRQEGKNHHDIRNPSRGSAGNLERDLQRLQYLLRHSPLTGGELTLAGAGDGDGSGTTSAQQPQQHRAMVDGEGDSAVVHEKRTREARRPNTSASPVTPEVKRDRRETVAYYAPPPPLTPLARYSETSPRHPGGDSASPARRSSVLDVGEDLGDGDATLVSGTLTPFSRVAAGVLGGDSEERFRRANAAMSTEGPLAKTASAAKVCSYRDLDDTVPSEGYSRQCAASAVVSSTGAWQRSPVRWFSSAAAATSRHDGHGEREEEVAMLCVSALDTWAKHCSAHERAQEAAPFNLVPMETSPPPKETSSRASHPPLSPFHSEVLSTLEAPAKTALPSTSPPPRVPGPSPFPLARSCRSAASAAGLAFPTPALGEDGAAPPFAATSPRQAAEPQPALHSGGGQHGNGVLAEGRTPCAASALPLEAMRTISRHALKAFYARQSSCGALLTPLRVEETA